MMIAGLILVADENFVLPFSAIEMQLYIMLIWFKKIIFLIISAYFYAHFRQEKSSLLFTN